MVSNVQHFFMLFGHLAWLPGSLLTYFIFGIFEMESHYVVQADTELTLLLRLAFIPGEPSAWASRVLG